MATLTQFSVPTGPAACPGAALPSRRHGVAAADRVGAPSSGLAFRPDPARWLAELDRAPRSRLDAPVVVDRPANRPGEPPRPRGGRARGVVLVGLMVALASAWSIAGWVAGPGSGVDPVGAGTTPDAQTIVVVQPGDTLWSVAAEIDPDGDVRATVDRLAERNGGSTLTVGQRLVVAE